MKIRRIRDPTPNHPGSATTASKKGMKWILIREYLIKIIANTKYPTFYLNYRPKA
jgi:hypothetical protein